MMQKRSFFLLSASAGKPRSDDAGESTQFIEFMLSVIHASLMKAVSMSDEPQSKAALRWQKIQAYLKTHEVIQNADVQKLCGVSAATAGRILAGLTTEGKLTAAAMADIGDTEKCERSPFFDKNVRKTDFVHMVDLKGIEPSNLTDANRALSQLSYRPICDFETVSDRNRVICYHMFPQMSRVRRTSRLFFRPECAPPLTGRSRPDSGRR